MPKHFPYVLLLLLLPLLGGCPQVQTIRIVQDKPEDVGTLLEQHEFARVRNLATRYPAIDTIELQNTIASLESAYVQDMLAQARTLEADEEFLNAVELLSDALRRVPHSTPLRELRTALESRRVHQLKVNERNSLIVRAEYLLDRKRLYAQQINLQAPSFEQRREHEKQENQRITLSKQLLEHARYAMQVQELDAADTCLTLAQQLNEAAEAAGLKAELRAVQKSQQESDRKAVSIRKARIKRKTDLNEKDETEKLLATTQKALNENKLHDAREAFTKIPPSTSQDSEVVAVQNTLDQALSTRIEHLIVTGDAQYRADQISEALQTWSEALALDPDNVELRERTDRANKVLANLQELKRQQQK